MIELAAIIVLVFIAWMLERIARELKAITTELSTARWERGKMAREARRESETA